jgi:metal iron transporter
VADLASAHQLLTSRVGVGSGYIFAIALLVAGQAASITVTLAGQIVSEGFIEWRTRPFVRRLVTRLIGIVPSAIVAASVGPQGVDDLLVGSQVALSMVLPFVSLFLLFFRLVTILKELKRRPENHVYIFTSRFVVLPLIIFTSDPQTMTMPNYHSLPSGSPIGSPTTTHPTKPPGENENEGSLALMSSNESTFENNLATKIIVGLIFCFCCVANVYAIVQLAQGRT